MPGIGLAEIIQNSVMSISFVKWAIITKGGYVPHYVASILINKTMSIRSYISLPIEIKVLNWSRFVSALEQFVVRAQLGINQGITLAGLYKDAYSETW